ncbi:hypothetical protein BpHYR1_024283 [Brachionus plicatilis]|uniref:Uncharacterized protein n=1 Tax=Brachionus plicatilis TaxID=10195 RepID=A0A3M7RCG8_BRAPC|nr:hypothetical protein BpHYR1_024283 [Brachionus plicatilis]
MPKILNFEEFNACMLKKDQIHYPKSNLVSCTICKHRDCYNFGEYPHRLNQCICLKQRDRFIQKHAYFTLGEHNSQLIDGARRGMTQKAILNPYFFCVMRNFFVSFDLEFFLCVKTSFLVVKNRFLVVKRLFPIYLKYSCKILKLNFNEKKR